MTRREARIRARRYRARQRRRLAAFVLLVASVILAPGMIDAVYKPQTEVVYYETTGHFSESVARPPMPLRLGNPGLSVYELIDLRGRPSWRLNPQRDWVRLLRLLGDHEQVISFEEGVLVQARRAPMQRIFDGTAPEVETLDALDWSAFDPNADRIEQMILKPREPFVRTARSTMVPLSPIPEPRPVMLALVGLLGLAVAAHRRYGRCA